MGRFCGSSKAGTRDAFGIALAASQLGTVLTQTPAGAPIDRVRWKQLAMVLAAASIALECVVLYLVPAPAVFLAAQAVIGATATIFPPAIAAVTLGVQPRRQHRGGGPGRGAAYLFGDGAMFFLVAGMADLSITATGLIRERDIDHE